MARVPVPIANRFPREEEQAESILHRDLLTTQDLRKPVEEVEWLTEANAEAQVERAETISTVIFRQLANR